MANFVMSTGLQNVCEADNVAVDVAMRVFKWISYSSLRSQIDNNIWLKFRKKNVDTVSVSQIKFMEIELVWVAKLLPQIDIIIIIEVGHNSKRDMHTNKTSNQSFSLSPLSVP